MGRGKKQRDSENPETHSLLSMGPNVGLDLMTLGVGPEPKSRVGHLSECGTQVPSLAILIIKID